MICNISAAGSEDVVRTIRYYNSQPGRYGMAFQAEMIAAMTRIAENPRLFSPVEDGIEGLEVREYFIERFEQRVLFVMTDDQPMVVAVIHASAQPDRWHRNLLR